jgi:hypothetical protein
MAKVTIVNVETGEIIERDETNEELNKRLEIKEKWEKELAAKKAKETQTQSAKAALLEKLGITEEEAKLLLS